MDNKTEPNVAADSTSKPTEEPATKQPETNEEQQPAVSSWWGTASSWYDSAVKKLEEVEEKLDEKLDVWVDSAKKKIEETNEFMRRDMGEFAQAVKQDASKIVNSTAEQLNINLNLEEAGEKTRIVTSQIGSFINKVVEKVAPQMPDDDEENLLVGTRKGVKTLDAYQAKIFHLQTNPETYLTGADDEEEYKKFCENFSIDENKEELSGIMLDFKEVRSIYTKLVPDAVTHEDFWMRYFYKKSLIQKAEERRALLAERVDKLNNSTQDLTWDVSDDENEEKEETGSEDKSSKEVEFKSLQDTKELTAPQPESIRSSEKSEDKKLKSDDSSKDIKEENLSEDKTSSEVSTNKTNESASDEKDPTPAKKNLPVEKKAPQTTESPSKDQDKNQTPDDAAEKKHDLINESNDNISNNSKETSSCEIVDIKASEESIKKETSECSDWVEDFESDIDMTEDEINKINESVQQDDNISGDDWENWE